MMGPEQKQMMEKGAHFPNYNSNEYGFLRTHPTQGTDLKKCGSG